MKKKKIMVYILSVVIAFGANGSVFATSDVQTDPPMSENTSTDEGTSIPATTAGSVNVVKTGYIPGTLSSPPEIIGEAAVVVDMKSGYTLYEKNIQAQHYPASITKIMTATLALENLKMENVITFSHDAVFTIEPGSSSAYANEGEQLTAEQCLYGLMLISGNDLANGLGEAVAGSMDAFAEMMTNKAKELGCVGTNFKNAHGLHDEQHYTTAYDMAIMAINIYKESETFRTLCSTIRYDVPPTNLCEETRYWLNNNRMIREGEEYYYPDCIGGKTGYTNEAGGTLVTFANLNGRQVMCVILKSTNSATAYSDSIALYDYVKANITDVDYTVLDEKAAEDESLALAALEALNPTGAPTTEAKKSADETDSTEKESKNFSGVVKIILMLVVLFVLAYFYVGFKRYQLRMRRGQRRRQQEMTERERAIRQKQLDRELEERRKKYKNIDFKN